MPAVAFSGLGQMGSPMAARLLSRTTADLPVTAASRRWIDAAAAAGLGDEDYSAVIKTILGQSG